MSCCSTWPTALPDLPRYDAFFAVELHSNTFLVCEHISVDMRLLKYLLNDDFDLVSFDDNNPPLYTILSHTQIDGKEVTYNELVTGIGKNKPSYNKIRFYI